MISLQFVDKSSGLIFLKTALAMREVDMLGKINSSLFFQTIRSVSGHEQIQNKLSTN